MREIFTVFALFLVVAIALSMQSVGLFFVAVGASIDFALLFDQFALVALLVVALILVKAAVPYALARIFNIHHTHQRLFTLAACTRGEFAFVFLIMTNKLQILTPEQISPAKHVIIAGYGRFGQIIGRLLSTQGYDISMLDIARVKLIYYAALVTQCIIVMPHVRYYSKPQELIRHNC